MAKLFHCNVPTILTLIRLILSPIVLPILLVYLLPYNSAFINYPLASLFVLFGLTDFFDGYLARKLQQETRTGRVLDPIADKFLVYSTLIALLAVSKIYFFWVIILIGREFFVMGLRLFALEHRIAANVSVFGKLKTVLQMLYLTVAIANPYQSLGLYSNGSVHGWNLLEALLLALTLFTSLFSAWRYYQTFILEFERIDAKQETFVAEHTDDLPRIGEG